MKVLQEKLDPGLRDAICDRLNGWELVEFLSIPIEDIVALLEDQIIENINDVADFIDYDYGYENEQD